MNNTTNNIINTNSDNAPILTPKETIISMFDNTDKNGVLYVPELYCSNIFDNTERSYRCVMDWNKADLNDALCHFESEYNALKAISDIYESICSESDAETLPDNLKKAWNTYIRDFETGDLDMDLIGDIEDRMEDLSMVEAIAGNICLGIDVSEAELSLYNDYKDTTVSEDEKALYDSYKAAVNADADRRVGDNYAAYSLVLSAKRLCKLMSLGAPRIIIDNEANIFAKAMMIHTYCKDLEIVEDAG